MDIFTITITRKRVIDKKQTEWKQVMSTELARERNEKEYAYVSAILPVQETDKIYEQTLEGSMFRRIDHIIRAVNGMDK
jgi:hypothetical protein